MRAMPRLVLGLLLGVAADSATAQVPYRRLVEASREPGQWLSYSRTYDGQRHSPLDQITPANVRRLRPVWIFQAEAPGDLETSPLFVDGVLYVTEPGSQVQAVKALDARTGRVLWKYERPLPKNLLTIGFPRANRGAAILGDTLYVGTLDAHLVALDARSGALRFDVEVASNATGHCITGAPLAVDGMVVVGISGGEAGIRGFLDAYDAKTGARRWRLWTIPGPGEPGHETWGGDAWKTGGGPTWVTGSYDPQLRLLYWGTGNPGPDWNGDLRPGDNLYTNSLLAIDADTGQLRWHFQFTPHDTHDWDATHVPVLIDAVHGGRPRKLVAMANRNAFFYVLDRETGEFLQGTPYAKQTWAEGLDAEGPADRQARHRPLGGGNSRLAEPQRSHRLVQPLLQPEDRPLLRGGAREGVHLLQGRGGVQTRHAVHGRRREGPRGRAAVGRHPRARSRERAAALGVPARFSSLGGRAEHRGRARVRERRRGQRVRARRDDGPTALGFPDRSDGRTHGVEPDELPGGREAARDLHGGPEPHRLRPRRVGQPKPKAPVWPGISRSLKAPSGARRPSSGRW